MWLKKTAAVIAVLMCNANIGTAQEPEACEDPQPYLGIGTFHCQGGTCIVDRASATQERYVVVDGRRVGVRRPDMNPLDLPWSFSVEPSLWNIDPDGPAAGAVRGGDVLVAVNSDPITTREGAAHLAEMRPGQPLSLILRRGSIPFEPSDGTGPYRMVHVVVEPTESCERHAASAGSSERPAGWEPRPSTRLSAPVAFRNAPVKYRNVRILGADPGTGITLRSATPLRAGSLQTALPLRVPTLLRAGSLQTALQGKVASDLYNSRSTQLAGFPFRYEQLDLVRIEGLGLSLGGGKQITFGVAGDMSWRFLENPVVRGIDAGGRAARAGLAVGQEILEVAGHAATTAEGARALLAAAAGQPMTLRVRVDGEVRDVLVR